MEMMFLFIFIAFIAGIFKTKYSNLFIALMWIYIGFVSAFSFNDALKNGTIDAQQYKARFDVSYVFAVVGLVYLLPAMLEIGKRKKKPEEKEIDL